MDYQEAIEILKKNKPTSDPRRCGKELCTACDVAISSMQELKMYKDGKLCSIPEDVYGKQCEELDRYKELGTLEEVREAVEKQKKKKPIEDRHHGIRYTEVYRCPSCNGSFSGRGFAKYCFHCGQAIDWSEKE